jgi:hypothetical protein
MPQTRSAKQKALVFDSRAWRVVINDPNRDERIHDFATCKWKQYLFGSDAGQRNHDGT